MYRDTSSVDCAPRELTHASIVGFSSRTVLTLCCCMFSSASGTMSPGTLSNFCKYSFHLVITLLLFQMYKLFRQWIPHFI